MLIFSCFMRKDAIIETGYKDTKFTCDYNIGKYKDLFLQVLVATGNDLHVEKL